jgi:hypothetical protein
MNEEGAGEHLADRDAVAREQPAWLPEHEQDRHDGNRRAEEDGDPDVGMGRVGQVVGVSASAVAMPATH